MKEKLAIVTGSTSGIGLGIAKELAREKISIILHGIEQQADHLVKELLEIGAPNVSYQMANMANPIEIEKMFADIGQKFGGVDILVNNAGIQHVAPIDEFPHEKWEAIMRINLIASFYTIKFSLSHMKKQKWGRIVNMASAHGHVASPFKSAYVAAKHGLLGLTKTTALEVATFGITANSICPGYVKTPLVLGQVADTAKARGITEKEVIENILLAAQPTKKFVEIEEIAKLCAFLIKPEASSINGAALNIDGGWTVQ